MRHAFLLGIFLSPGLVFALEFRDQSLLYTDAPFLPGEAAGISVLTDLGAVEGNPDGSFAPHRTLNRAEFLKIVLSSHPEIRVAMSDNDNCFPDVRREDWFSRYVCLAKKRGIVGGYPDGTFRPGNPVNYAEALKILGELYDYSAYAEPDAPWYQMYAQAAQNHGTALPLTLGYDESLTRGQMARLAAAYRAEHDGQLQVYRDAEGGRYPAQEQSSSQPPAVPAPASSSSSSAVSSVAAQPDLPARSRFLLLGQRRTVADGTFTPVDGDVRIRRIQVDLRDEIETIESLHVMDENGGEVARLTLDPYDSEHERWIAAWNGTGMVLPVRRGTRLSIEAQLYADARGGFQSRFLEVRVFRLTVQPAAGGDDIELVAGSAHFPQHQLAVGEMTGIGNAGEVRGDLVSGNDLKIGSFLFRGATTGTAPLRIEDLRIDVTTQGAVAVTKWKVGTPGSPLLHECSMESLAIINCLSIPQDIGELTFGSRVIDVYGSVSAKGTDPNVLQVWLGSAGSLTTNGSMRWTDGTGRYGWVDLPEPLAVGTRWEAQ